MRRAARWTRPKTSAPTIGSEGTISTDDSTVGVEVLPVDEATLLALDAARLLST